MKKPKIKPHMSLREVRTLNQVCAMPRDNHNWGDFSLSTDGNAVWLSEQKLGAAPTQQFEMPKGVFDRLADRYFQRVLVTAPRRKK